MELKFLQKAATFESLHPQLKGNLGKQICPSAQIGKERTCLPLPWLQVEETKRASLRVHYTWGHFFPRVCNSNRCYHVEYKIPPKEVA